MSSLRNAVKRITHKERSQPNERKHLGILEKKKDYVQRAGDYHRKQDRIQRLQQKAAMRNPEEFYFRMNSSSMKDGKHTSHEDYRDLPPQLVRLMKDQDLKWVRMQRQQDRNKVEKLQACLHQLEESTNTSTHNDNQQPQHAKHTIFVETQEQATNFTVANHFDTLPELAHRSFNRLRKGDVAKMASTTDGNLVLRTSEEEKEQHTLATTTKNPTATSSIHRQLQQIGRKAAKARSQAYKEWQARQDRVKVLTLAEQQLQTEKFVAGKGRKRKIATATPGQHPAQYKWRRRRMK